MTVQTSSGPALVLGGGGVLGAFQAGFLKALFRTGFRPSMIVGTSAGARNAAFMAFRPDADGAAELARIWTSLRDRQLFFFNPMRAAVQLMSGGLCLSRNDMLRTLVERNVSVDNFAATAVPLYITTTNLARACKQVFHEGPVSRAVLASAAVPGIFCPIEIEGDLHIDGGVVANLDIETAVDLGATEIIAVDLSRCMDGRRPSNLASLLMQTLDVIQRQRVDHDVGALAARARITLLQPSPDGGFGLGDFHHVDRLLEEGERMGESALALCMGPDGRMKPGVIHDPLHLHEWPAHAA
ncbi:MAG: patatin-like phospholipase family protein [Dehalococcoidia bacterium]|nr:MAG: patatin-like phospholipase family protein [Dehalococcoidia bacterium]